MNREALIERLAEMQHTGAWNSGDTIVCDGCREFAESIILPAIVEFVASWIEGQDWLYADGARSYLAPKWREQMTAPAAGGEEGP